MALALTWSRLIPQPPLTASQQTSSYLEMYPFQWLGPYRRRQVLLLPPMPFSDSKLHQLQLQFRLQAPVA